MILLISFAVVLKIVNVYGELSTTEFPSTSTTFLKTDSAEHKSTTTITTYTNATINHGESSQLSFHEVTNIVLIALLFAIIILCIILIFVIKNKSKSSNEKIINTIMELQRQSQSQTQSHRMYSILHIEILCINLKSD